MNLKTKNKNAHLIPMNLTTYKKNIILIDTETIGDLVKGEKVFPYDISYLIFNLEKAREKARTSDNINEIIKAGTLEKLSLINKDIFDNDYLINSAFYKNKIPFYKWQLIYNRNTYKKMVATDILLHLNKVIKQYNITTLVAYNSNFDYTSINNLYSINKEVKRNECKKLYQLDLWQVATMIFKQSNKYKDFCKTHNLITATGKNYQTSAESFYKYITKNANFVEHHTGLRDINIEVELLVKLSPYIKRYKLDSNFDKRIFWKGGAYNIES